MDKPSLTVGLQPRMSQSPADGTVPTDMFRQGSVRRLVAFSLDGQRYALHLSVVERVLRMVAVSPLPLAPAIVLGVVNVHGQIIPVLDFQRRFGRSSRTHGLSSTLLVARTSRRTMALPVNEVLGVQEVAVEMVTLPNVVFPGIGLVTGIVTLSDGVLFIHDLDAFLSFDEEQRLTAALDGKTE